MPDRPLYFVLPDAAGTRILMQQDGVRLTLPAYDRPVAANVAFDAPAPFNEYFHRHYGITVRRRYAVDLTHAQAVLFVLEATDGVASARGNWVCHKQAAEMQDGQPLLSDALQALPHDWCHSRTMPWVSPTGFQPYLVWLHRTLRKLGLTQTGPLVQIKNAYVSTVFCCPTHRGPLYLKIPGPLFIREVPITRMLMQAGLVQSPVWLAHDATLNAILMDDLGGQDLPTDASVNELTRVMVALAQWQLASVGRVPAGNPFPLYDWRIDSLITQADSLIDRGTRLLTGSPYALSSSEYQELSAAIVSWQKVCRGLLGSPVPPAVDHGDVRPGNIRLVNGSILFYDWAWSAVSHPFFSAVQLLSTLPRTPAVQEAMPHLREAYLDAWKHYAPLSHLQIEFDAVYALRWLYFAVGDAQWLAAISSAFDGIRPSPTSADAWTLDRRQYYFAKVLRRLNHKEKGPRNGSGIG